MSDMAEKILALVRERGNVSFAELNREIEGFTGGQVSLAVEGHSNIVLWANMTEEGAAAIEKLRTSGAIQAKPTTLLVYLIDGVALTLPIAKRRRHYKRPHWAPAVLSAQKQAPRP